MRRQKDFPQAGAQMVEQDGRPAQAWWRFFSLQFSNPPVESSVTLTGSPHTYTATADCCVTVNGGTVSVIAIVRGGTAYTTGETAGQFRLRKSDGLRITYTVAPTVTLFPD